MQTIINNHNEKLGECPVPVFWKTHSKGNIYVYDKYWKNLINIVQNNKKFNITRKEISKELQIDGRLLRRWSNENINPRLYTEKEFELSKLNLYFIGLYFSDGHIRNNGADLSYTYQTDSSNIFQGYWYPQLIQRFFPIFKHKEKISSTYIDRNRGFKTNLSGISPIFIKFIENKGIIVKLNKTKTSGFKKELPFNFLKSIKIKEQLFQGIFDGDGSVNNYQNTFTINLALDPENNFHKPMQEFNLVPTLAITNKRKSLSYNQKIENLYSIRLAPSSIGKLNLKKYSARDVVSQLEFMLISAKNSIRPDKVHSLIKTVNIICSKRYGENKNSILIQREIRDLANKKDLKKKANKLEKQYPVKDDKYLPFRPLWAKEICSKKERFSNIWDFFFNLENLNLKNYPHKEKFSFEGGIPINFKL